MIEDDHAKEEIVGYCHPPCASRFRKGQSGNPKGRPRGRRRELPYEAVLGREAIVRENGHERRVTAEEAFLLQLTKRGLEGDTAAARALLAAIADQRGTEMPIAHRSSKTVVRFVEPGSVDTAVECLRIGTKLDRFRTPRLVLEPWIVEAALARFAEKRLTPEEQEVVVKATRTPAKVHWPHWWVVKP